MYVYFFIIFLYKIEQTINFNIFKTVGMEQSLQCKQANSLESKLCALPVQVSTKAV